MTRLVAEFREALVTAGIEPSEGLICDGNLHRFHVVGDKSRTKNGWYVLHPDNPPAGHYGCWKRDISQTWSRKPCRSMSRDERTAFNAKVERIKRQLEEEQELLRAECRDLSAVLWSRASPARPTHPYLQKKGVKAYGLKWDRGALLVPVVDVDGVLHGLQRIWRGGDGGKRFELGTAVTGHFHLIGEVEGNPLIICEGYATAASLHEATGLPVAVAFDAGNLLAVATALRAKYQGRMLVIAGDNDQWTERNTGVAKATEASQAIGGKLVVPSFEDTEGKPTDFNDLHQLSGKEAVRESLQFQGVRLV